MGSPLPSIRPSAKTLSLFLANRALAYIRLGDRELALSDITAIAGVKVSDSLDESSLLALVGLNTKLVVTLLANDGGPSTTWLISAALAGCANCCKGEDQAALKTQYQEASYFFMGSSTDWVNAHGGYGLEACPLDSEHEPMYKASLERFMKVISGLDGEPPRPYRVFH